VNSTIRFVFLYDLLDEIMVLYFGEGSGGADGVNAIPTLKLAVAFAGCCMNR
jgi:hypothetical protein